MAFLHLVFKGGSGIQRGANWFSWWFRDTGSGEPSDGPDLIDGVMGRLNTHMAAYLHEYYNIGRGDYTYYPDLLEDPYPSQVHNFSSFTGDDTSSALPSRMTLLVEFKAFANVGPTRKRIYVGCYGEAQNTTSGAPDAGTVVALRAFANAMLGGLSVNGHDWLPVVCRLNADTGQITAWNGLNSHVSNVKWAYLRSRDAAVGM